ncbi:hypothetical protein V8B97DRAFT_2020725 [Scleroderma yunnanense]
MNSLSGGDILSGTFLSLPVDELAIERNEIPADFGTDIHELHDIPANSAARKSLQVSPESPYYPWPSKVKWNDQICDAIRSPTEKVTSCVGNVFYINNISQAIAKDFANPLMCFAMQDYPEDGGSGMSQIYHGEKMLLDLPSHPAACVHRKIYFMDEILQESEGGYFIPHRGA